MAMGQVPTPREKRLFSRRDFLKGVPLGIAGALVATAVSGRLISLISRRRRQPPVFPEGSIFTPAKERRTKI